MIEAVGVIIPAHDEEALLPACITALESALAAVPIANYALIVLDACRDRSAAACRGVATEACELRNAGAARALGAKRVLEHFAIDPAKIWLATTDADTRVPHDWLVEQLAIASAGGEAVAGTIEIDDWSEHPSGVADKFVRFYAGSGESHSHVHGANLGVRGDAYLAAGGFRAFATGEDHALWRALAGRNRIATRRIPVVTSARRSGRAPDGFAGFLVALAG